MKIIDISKNVDEKTLVYPGDTPFTLNWLTENPIKTSEILVTPHVGTHIDGPMHFAFSDKGIGSYDLRYFVGPCLVLDEQTCLDIKKLKEAFDVHREHHIQKVLFKFDSTGGIPLETLCYLQLKGVHLIGTTNNSVDDEKSHNFEVHKAALKEHIFLLESLVLDGVSCGVYQLSAVPLKWTKAEASPVRAYLLEFE